ncbi:MAG: oligosaccharide flippase family protein, partial [Sulfuricella sp.]|nr:oligosaccharide flippase family protein [Sulfuricella sp.]
MTTHSLKKRFIYKLLGNFAALILGVVALAVVPRSLGPADFGRFEFLTANFNLVLNTLTLQLPAAYFNWISRKGHKENTDYASGVVFYQSILVIIGFAIFIAVAVLLGINDWIWPDIQPIYLWFALAFSSVTFLYQLCTYLADGRALTVGFEKARLFQNILKTVGILTLFIWGMLTLKYYFIVQASAILVTVLISMVWLAFRGAYSNRILYPWTFEKLARDEFHSFAIQYARPLMVTMLVGF